MTKEWTAEEILREVRGFQAGCVIIAAAELDVFTLLGRGSATALSAAAEMGTDPRATTVLLDALSGLDLLVKDGKEYRVPAAVAELLSEAGGGSILPAVRHTGNCLRRWARLSEVTLSGRPAERSPSIGGATADEAAFIAAMDNFSAPVAAEVVARLGPLEFTHLLDIGGGCGTWTAALLAMAPGARATLFDLPTVIPLSRRHIANAGLGERVTFAAGDYLLDDLPAGADLALLSAIAHQNSRRQNRTLFAAIHAALEDGGILIIRDVVMDSSRTEPAYGALFAVNMLVATEGGGTYTFDEFREDLAEAGFVEVTLVHRDDGMNSLIRAEKKR